MNKLEEYRQELSKRYEEPYWNSGFDAAIALNLPIKFSEWQEEYRAKEMSRIHSLPYGDEKKKEYINLTIRFINKKELYQYWIENCYKPE